MTNRRRTPLRRTVGCLLGALVLAGCSEGAQITAGDDVAAPAESATPVSDCDSAFAAAASAAPGPQRDEDLWATFDACADLAAFTTAAAGYPDVLTDDPEPFATAACRDEPDVDGSVLCEAIGATG